jgi:hypothetical protein
LLDELDQVGIDHQRVIVEAGELDHVCLLVFDGSTEEGPPLSKASTVMIGRNGEGGEMERGKEPGYLGAMPSDTCGNKAWTCPADDAA